MNESEIERALRYNRKRLLAGIAQQVKRWQGVDAVDLEGLQGLIDERKQIQPKPADA